MQTVAIPYFTLRLFISIAIRREINDLPLQPMGDHRSSFTGWPRITAASPCTAASGGRQSLSKRLVRRRPPLTPTAPLSLPPRASSPDSVLSAPIAAAAPPPRCAPFQQPAPAALTRRRCAASINSSPPASAPSKPRRRRARPRRNGSRDHRNTDRWRRQQDQAQRLRRATEATFGRPRRHRNPLRLKRRSALGPLVRSPQRALPNILNLSRKRSAQCIYLP